MSSMASFYKKPSVHRRNNSGELHVFEAANYFSSASNIINDNQSVSSHEPTNFTTKSCKEYDHQAWKPKGARMSLDALGRPSMLKVPELKQSGHKVLDDDDRVLKEKMNKIKQPSSPGGRLASFLNALFNHSAPKKKKNTRQDDLKPRMRRSSISHMDSRSMCLSASTPASGFRTPPPVYKTLFDDSKSLQDHKRVTPSMPPKQMGIESRAKSSIGLDQRTKISNGSLSAFDKIERRNLAKGVGEKEKIWGDKKIEFKKIDTNTVERFKFKKNVKDEEEEDAGDQSDTSSDLFELQNYDLGEFPSGLPVYETTNVQPINNSAKPDSK